MDSRRYVTWLLCVAPLLGGCGSSGPRLFPVTGQVLVDGQPAAGVTVVFHPVADAPGAERPSGVTGSDGSFRLANYRRGNGAPAGEYIVLATWYPPDAREQENPVNRLPEKFADPAQTPLPRVTIKEGTNTLEPFRLSTK